MDIFVLKDFYPFQIALHVSMYQIPEEISSSMLLISYNQGEVTLTYTGNKGWELPAF